MLQPAGFHFGINRFSCL